MTLKQGSPENVKVVVRMRPLSEDEKSAGYHNIVHIDKINGTVKLFDDTRAIDRPTKSFSFDTVFDPDVSQMDVYNRVARPIVDNVLDGYNGTIFAYGQTGTGKTFTMEGDSSSAELKGIIPNSFAHIFGHIAKADDDTKFLVRVSYLEIYNEEVRDLLCRDGKGHLEVKERPDVGVYVRDLLTFVVNNADDMDRVMRLGNNNRSVGATNMNVHSSRSHAIFSITIECSSKFADDGLEHFVVGKLHLVDLAGSERLSKSGATGQRLKEATKINLSLSTLGNVISALVDGQSSHIPYRNSKLTRLLQDSLGGNSKTLMFANIGPANYNYDETLGTLRYASRAKNIENHAKVNEDPKDALMKKYQLQIKELRGLLESEADPPDLNEDVAKPSAHEIKTIIEQERKKLNAEKNMAVEERNSLLATLKQHETQLVSVQNEREAAKSKLLALERKIIVGGENLLEKSELQERLLEESARELSETIRQEAAMKDALQAKEAERLDIEEKYSSLQEEAIGKSKKLKKLCGLLQSAKAELFDLQREQQREMEGLHDNIRQLTRELRLQIVIVDYFVPFEYQTLIADSASWNESIGEWQLRAVAYTGNNMRKNVEPDELISCRRSLYDMSSVYHELYSQANATMTGIRPKTARKNMVSRSKSRI